MNVAAGSAAGGTVSFATSGRVKMHMKLMRSIMKSAWATGFTIIKCKGESCDRWLTLRHISGRRVGIRMRDCWYCSSGCFKSASEAQFSQLLAADPVQVNQVSRMSLGRVMISRGLLSHEQLRTADEEQRLTGGEIGEILVRQGSVSEKQVTAIRAAQWGCPVFATQKRGLPTSVQIPATLIKHYSMIPLHYVAATNRLLVGFVYSIEYELLYAIEQMTGCKTEPCFVTPSDFQIQMNKTGHAQVMAEAVNASELKFENIQTPAEMAHILGSYGFDIEVDEAIIGKCRDYLWARLKSGSKAIDFLFKGA